MLVKFSVTNFRSIRQTQTLDMIATDDKELSENCCPLINSDVQLIKTAAIYGGNATGKSNLLKAMEFVQEFIVSSSKDKQAGEAINVVPFLLNSECETKPSEFEITFVINTTRYQYGFAATKEQVVEEYLFVYSETDSEKWFHRIYDDNQYHWQIATRFEFDTIELVKQLTRNNALFISTAAQVNHAPSIKIVEWFKDKFAVFALHRLNPEFSKNWLFQKNKKQKLLDMLQQADFSIVDIHVENRRIIKDDLPHEIPEELKKIFSEIKKEIPMIYTLHRHNETGNLVTFDIDDESQGTKTFFALAAPIFDILEKGNVLVIDEIDSSLHPNLVREIIKLFHDSQTNPHHAQLVFVTHDTSLIDSFLLRSDQIWLTERDNQQATILYPLTDYELKEGESWQKGYLRGRYGGISHIKKLLDKKE